MGKCVAGILGASLLLGACSSVRSPGVPSNPWLGGPPACSRESDKCTQADALQSIATAQAYCMDLREYYERGGQVTGSQRLFVGLLGSLAGSVFSITAGGTASKAWAGLSGATNGIQTQIDQTSTKFDAPEAVELIANEQEKFSTQIKPLLENSNWSKAVSHSVLLPDACSREAGRGISKARSVAKSAQAAASSAVAAASAAMSAASAAAGVKTGK